MGHRSRAPEVVRALVALLRAADLDGAVVHLGPAPDDDTADAVAVAYDLDPDSTGQAVRTESTWAGLGANRRAEAITVTCAAYHLDGDADPDGAMGRVYDLLALAEDAVHADPSLGLTPGPVTAQVASSDLLFLPTDAGLEAWLGFTVTVQTRP